MSRLQLRHWRTLSGCGRVWERIPSHCRQSNSEGRFRPARMPAGISERQANSWPGNSGELVRSAPHNEAQKKEMGFSLTLCAKH
jgi:hypothetical protein